MYPRCPYCGEKHKQCEPSRIEVEGLQYEDPPRRIQEFVVGQRLDGMNDIIGKARTHWTVGARQKKEQQAIVMDYAFVAKLTPIAGPFRLDIVWVEKDDARDPDNITAAKKFILDGLQEMGMIKNDNQKYLTGWSESWRIATKDKPVGVYIKLIEE